MICLHVEAICLNIERGPYLLYNQWGLCPQKPAHHRYTSSAMTDWILHKLSQQQLFMLDESIKEERPLGKMEAISKHSTLCVTEIDQTLKLSYGNSSNSDKMRGKFSSPIEECWDAQLIREQHNLPGSDKDIVSSGRQNASEVLSYETKDIITVNDTKMIEENLGNLFKRKSNQPQFKNGSQCTNKQKKNVWWDKFKSNQTPI
ncbi:MAG: hypothetical protein EZS28_004873 [Streblomastix strix]|uniref:Uncharacterized protein n=1 Tax=Streblomastix strix TaxID=222440 RepID=A0A5J4WYK9_9EUKA|nr:MAG: hypothetical protein EZS28_004873 [Streblomastix strix]